MDDITNNNYSNIKEQPKPSISDKNNERQNLETLVNKKENKLMAD